MLLRLALFTAYYARWHYTRALFDLARIEGNLLVFVARFFGMRLHLRTLFSPWRRLGEAYPSGFTPADFLATLIVNSLMRIVGFAVRSATLALGAVALFFAFLTTKIVFAAWLALPVMVYWLGALGIRLLVS